MALAESHGKETDAGTCLFVRGGAPLIKPRICLRQHRRHLHGTRPHIRKDVLAFVLQNVLVQLGAKAFLNLPGAVKLNCVALAREVTTDDQLGKSLHEILYPHAEYPIILIPRMYKSFVYLVLPLHLILTVEGLLDIGCPEVVVHIGTAARPLNCVSPRTLEPNKEEVLRGSHAVYCFHSPRIKNAVHVEGLDSLCNCLRINLLLFDGLHPGKHFQVQLAADNRMVERERSQRIKQRSSTGHRTPIIDKAVFDRYAHQILQSLVGLSALEGKITAVQLCIGLLNQANPEKEWVSAPGEELQRLAVR